MSSYKTETQLIKEGILSSCQVEGCKEYKPNKLLMQWHITERCNLKCLHCYQEGEPTKEVDCSTLETILKQYVSLLKKWKIRGHINLTGGEPFIRKDVFDLLEMFHSYRKVLSYGILSNGTMIDSQKAKRLKSLGCGFVQVSLEGKRNTNDCIRGKGNFGQVKKAIKILSRHNIETLVSFSASRLNHLEFPDVVEVGRRCGAKMVWSDRIIPFGNGKEIKDQMMDPNEVREFFERMYRCRTNQKSHWFKSTNIPMHRALNFLTLYKYESSGDIPYYRCNAGDGLITILPNGDLLPCRRMPIIVGNVLEKNIEDLYYSSVLFNQLRRKDLIPEECKVCKAKFRCQGGLKCLSYAYYGTPFKADPQCFIINSNLP